MKVDIDSGDMYYDVYCDGVKLDKCLRADTNTGIAECILVDNNENVIHMDGQVSTYVCKGDIEIVKQAKDIFYGYQSL
jgi:hypothetical protein